MRYFLSLSIIVSTLFLLTACSPPADKLFAQGQAAYKLQDYHTAFEKIFAAARGGNYQAQYTLGYMYYYGIGAPHDPVEAVKWFRKAAYFGQPHAIHALKLIQDGAPQLLKIQLSRLPPPKKNNILLFP